MKNIRTILMTTGILAFLFSGCSEDFPERTPSYVPAADAIEAYFPSSNASTVEVAPTDTAYLITVSRVDTVNADTVLIKESYDMDNVFTVPESITFAAGQADTTIMITYGDLVDFQEYSLGIELDEESTNPYDTLVAGTTKFILHLTQTDWTDYAVGQYVSTLYGSWVQVMQHSTILNLYKLPNLWTIGSYLLFSWDGSAVVTPYGTSNGTYVGFPTGDSYPPYGAITAQIYEDPAKTFYTTSTQQFSFYVVYAMSEVAYKAITDTYTITSLL